MQLFTDLKIINKQFGLAKNALKQFIYYEFQFCCPLLCTELLHAFQRRH